MVTCLARGAVLHERLGYSGSNCSHWIWSGPVGDAELCLVAVQRIAASAGGFRYGACNASGFTATRVRRYALQAVVVLATQSATGKISNNWSQVQSVPPVSTVTVALRRDAVVDSLPHGKFKVKRVLASSSGASIVLQRKNGHSITIGKDSVRRVSARIPLSRRTNGWIGTAVALGTVQAFLSFVLDFDNLTPRSFALAHGGFTVPGAFFRGFGTREIYALPSQ